MDFDAVLDEIGELGRFQLTNYALLCLPVFFGAANSLSYVFTAGIPDYRCRITGCDKEGDAANFNELWVSLIVPPDPGLSPNQPFKPAQCSMYQRKDNLTECLADSFTDELVECHDWVYTDDELTIVTDWDITCYKNQWMLSLIGTLHFAGIVCGSGLFGFLADTYGRKLMFIFCIVLMAFSGILQAISPDYITFCIFVFINALGTSGVYPLAFIIGVEMVGRRRREASGIILNYFYALGEAAVGVLAWLIRDWRWLQGAVSAPAAVFVIYYWIIPESVRWLMAKQRNTKAYAIIQKAAKVNKVKLSDSLLSSFSMEKGEYVKHSECDSDEESGNSTDGQIYQTVLASMKSRVMVIRYLIIFYIWAANAFIFYGLSLNSTSMSGNKYVNFSLVCLVEIPGYTMAWIAMNRIGRRWSLAGSFFICAFSCLAAAFVPSGHWWVSTTLFLLGKVGITSSFGIVYVHTAELLPTVIRSGGVGMSSTLARIGAMIAPFVPLLNVYWDALPLILFGMSALMAALFSLMLPETLGCKLPDSVIEAENVGKTA